MFFDYDAIIVGGGPAGLTAGLYLARGKRRVLLLEKDIFGGPIMNVAWIENYPGFANGVSGADLASQMITQATDYGLKLEQAEVTGIESLSSCRWVKCADGASHTTGVVIIAGGARPRKLGVPGEEALRGKGVFNCAFCDGGKFAERVVAVCGGGDAGITEALYLTRLAAKVIVIEAMPALNACAVLQEKARANPKLEVRTGVRVESVVGDSQVEAVGLVDAAGHKDILGVDGVLVHIGLEPNSDYLKGTVPLDDRGCVVADNRMVTGIPHVLAAGDIRSGSPCQIITAAGDGATAAITAEGFLQQLA